MKPKDVNKTNENIVWVTLYGSPMGDLPLPKFRIGGTVRVSKYKSIFAKGYEANFTEEIFKISKVFRGDPAVYEIEDHEGEPIIGKFYEEELSAVNKKDDTAHDILRTTKKRLKDEFKKKYPNAHVSRFSFNVVLSETGDVTGTSVSFKVRDGRFLDITVPIFKKLYSGELYWEPQIWDTGGKVQPFVLSTNTLPYNVRKFTV